MKLIEKTSPAYKRRLVREINDRSRRGLSTRFVHAGFDHSPVVLGVRYHNNSGNIVVKVASYGRAFEVCQSHPDHKFIDMVGVEVVASRCA